MTPSQKLDALGRAGRALYGERWQSSIARDLHTSDRTVRRWAAGQNEIPWGVMAELRGLLMSRGAQIDALLHDLDRPA